MKPVIKIQGACLRPVTDEDEAACLALLRKPDVRRYLCDDRVLSGPDMRNMFAQSAAQDRDGLGLWMIENRECGCLGLAGLTPVGEPLHNLAAMRGGVEPVIAVDPALWGRGIARQSLAALVHYAELELHLGALVAAVDAPNAASHRLLEACGFRRNGEARGKAYDLLLYKRPISGPRLAQIAP